MSAPIAVLTKGRLQTPGEMKDEVLADIGEPVVEVSAPAKMEDLASAAIIARHREILMQDYVGFKPTQYTRQEERYHHRLIVLLKSKGMKNTEIQQVLAEQGAKISSIAIGQITRQPWAIKMLNELLANSGAGSVQTVFSSAAVKAAQVYEAVLDDPEVETKDKLRAADSILDRLYGRPRQSVEMTHKKDASKYSDEELVAIIDGGAGAA